MSSPNEQDAQHPQELPWAEQMRQFYYDTGAVRSEDLSRLLGDQGKVIYMVPLETAVQPTSHQPLFG
jgi:hypothetical protein